MDIIASCRPNRLGSVWIYICFFAISFILSACSLEDPLARPQPGGNQLIGESGWEIAVVVEPGDGVAGEVLEATFQLLDHKGEVLKREGVEVELSLNQNAFADGSPGAVELSNRMGTIGFEFIIEEAGLNYQLSALASDDSGEVREVVTSPFEIVAAAPSPQTSSISGGEGYVDDEEGAPVRIELFDEFGNPVVGEVPVFEASGEGNSYGACTAVDEGGVSKCTLESSEGGEKTLKLVEPIELEGETIHILAPRELEIVTAPTSGPAGGPVELVVQVLDHRGMAYEVAGVELLAELNQNQFRDGGTRLTAVTGEDGIAQFLGIIEIAAAGYELVVISENEHLDGVSVKTEPFDVEVVEVSAAYSMIRGADGQAGSIEGAQVEIELFDELQNPVVGVVPTFEASGEGNSYEPCSATDGAGRSTCVMTSTRAGQKTLKLTSPVEKSGATIEFFDIASLSVLAGPPASVKAGESFLVRIQARDRQGQPFKVAGVALRAKLNRKTFVGRGADGVVESTDGDGIAEFSLAVGEVDTGYAITIGPDSGNTNVGAVTTSFFEVQAAGAFAANSSISGEDGQVGSAEGAKVRIELFDEYQNPVVGVVPKFSATGSGNSYGACTATNSSGVATCVMTSTRAGSKKLSITSPVSKEGATVEFFAPTTVDIVTAPPALAKAGESFPVVVQVKDSQGQPFKVAGINLRASLNKNGFSSQSAQGLVASTNNEGVAEFSLAVDEAASGYRITATLEAALYDAISGTTSSFAVEAAEASLAYSGIYGQNGQIDSSAGAQITIELRDEFENPLIGVVPTFSATGDGNSYKTCSATDSSGGAICVMTSTKAGAKKLRITSPLSKEGQTIQFFGPDKLEFITGPPASMTAGQSFGIKVRVKDSDGKPFKVAGVEVRATLNRHHFRGRSSSGVVSTTDSNGIAEFSLAIDKADTGYVITTALERSGYPQLTAATSPFEVKVGEVSAGKSWIEGSDGYVHDSAGAAIEIGLFDTYENPIVGVTPTFSATGSGNSYGQCSATNAQGVASCVMTSTKAEQKALSITSPVQVQGGRIEFRWACNSGSAPFGAGNGSESEPYQICAPEHFQNIGGVDTAGKYFVMTQDIDMSGANNFVPIESFKGAFDGGGNIVNKLEVELPDNVNGGGVFTTIEEGALVRDVMFGDVKVDHYLSYGKATSGVAFSNKGVIQKVGVQGKVTGGFHPGAASSFVYNNYGRIEESYADISVAVECEFASGFVGMNHNGGVIVDSYTVSVVSDEYDCDLAGFLDVNQGRVERSYSAASYWGGKWVPTGWQSNIFMLVNTSQSNGNYYDNDLVAANGDEGIGASPLTREEFRDSSNFVGWDFENVWIIGTAPDGETRPILRWQVED